MPASSERQLIIHIGNHTAGAELIQHALFHNKARLAERGFSVYDQSRDGHIHKGGRVKGWIDIRRNTVYPELARSLAALHGNVAVSIEGLSWVFDREGIAQLQRELTEAFDNFKIVAYLRRQDKQAVSHHQQGSKASAGKAASFYGNSPTALPQYQPHFQDYLDYARRIGYWADAFGNPNICLRIFEPEFLKDGDVVNDFFATTGMEIPADTIHKNLSHGFVATKLGHLMHQKKVSPETAALLLSKLEPRGKLLPSAQEAMDFYANFREGNKSLKNRFNLSGQEYLFDEDFSGYPSVRKDLWTEETANEAIMGILAAINEIPILSREEEHLIRDCALKIEARNPALAKQLRKRVLRSRPRMRRTGAR
jgi:hypothetical protein